MSMSSILPQSQPGASGHLKSTRKRPLDLKRWPSASELASARSSILPFSCPVVKYGRCNRPFPQSRGGTKRERMTANPNIGSDPDDGRLSFCYLCGLGGTLAAHPLRVRRVRSSGGDGIIPDLDTSFACFIWVLGTTGLFQLDRDEKKICNWEVFCDGIHSSACYPARHASGR
jgi:hypothetical protein